MAPEGGAGTIATILRISAEDFVKSRYAT